MDIIERITKYVQKNQELVHIQLKQRHYRGSDKSLARPGRKQANVCQNGVNFLRRLALQGGDLMTAHVSMLLKSRVSLICFRACFLPGRAKDLSARR